MDWSFTSDNDRKIALQRGGIGKYRLTLKGEMQTYNMKVKNTVCTDFLLRMKDISTSDVVINIIVFRKEMIDCTNPAFKEMFSVTRQLEKLYDEIIIKISFEGKILDIEVVLTFYFVKIERNSYLCISKPSLKFLSCTKYWTKIQ